MKFIAVTGGVLSGLGKGITASSIGLLLKQCGYKVSAIKIDPYLNCDAGTMNPFQHGEVFVLEDGGEVDLDLGNYERFLDINMYSDHNITTGKVYKSVIEKERRGDYLGNTVQIIPHITNEIREQILQVAKNSKADIIIIELGGTVGDIESMPFLEAVRQLRMGLAPSDMIFVHTTLVLTMGVVGEQKTKPTQHSVKALMGLGIKPDIIVCRSDEKLNRATKEKIALFCDVPEEAIISAHDVSNVYLVPLLLNDQKVITTISKLLKLKKGKPNLRTWRRFVNKLTSREGEVNIALVGKYTGLKDSYISHIRALDHAGTELGVNINILWMDSEDLEQGRKLKKMRNTDGIIIPGGFGHRGSEGKILAAKLARENKIPFLGICFGFQLAVIEFCRNVLNLKNANSAELNSSTPYPVIDLLPEQKGIKDLGGTMRLGAQYVRIEKGTKAYNLYKETVVYERHRHRFEVNPEYIHQIENAGMKFSGKSKDNIKMEIAELKNHPYYVASQFHPEFKSRPTNPAPLYRGLIAAAIAHMNKSKKK
ncbi:MAG: CTP synthase (glutamine hydrolyzing) [Thermoplasmata archaeon]|nr:MAG: CTP synthase (glutamine hydrolyzing) [Thermoplasmata archaeon]